MVTTAGTAVALAAQTACRKVEITAELDNTDYIVIGDSTVVAALATRRGVPISPGSTLTIYARDLSTIYLDAVVSGEGVTYAYFF